VAKKSKPKFDPEAFLAKADGGVTISKYGKGQVVFNQGDPADCVFYIREGRVKIAVVSAQGKEAVVAFLKAGDFIGEGCLTGRPRRVSTARALEDTVITRLDKATMVRMIRAEPNFSERFTAHLLARGLIRYRRGCIVILDRKALEACACDCYHIMHDEKLPHALGVNL
jgi:CRP/FNR family transcriptional regulator, cyclic AMP receptor protein